MSVVDNHLRYMGGRRQSSTTHGRKETIIYDTWEEGDNHLRHMGGRRQSSTTHGRKETIIYDTWEEGDNHLRHMGGRRQSSTIHGRKERMKPQMTFCRNLTIIVNHVLRLSVKYIDSTTARRKLAKA